MNSISVIFPAFNEEKKIKHAIKETQSFFLSEGIKDYEIIVVDDGSSDKTANIAKQQGARVIKNRKNLGKGFSVRKGMLSATKKHVLFSDVDLSTPIYYLNDFMRFADKYDIVIASRNLNQSKVISRGGLRLVFGKGFAKLVSLLVLPPIKDSQCGFKLFKRECAQKVFALQTIGGWAFDVEILGIATELGYKIKELPVVWIGGLDSRLSLKAIPKMFLDLLKVRKSIQKLRAKKTNQET